MVQDRQGRPRRYRSEGMAGKPPAAGMFKGIFEVPAETLLRFIFNHNAFEFQNNKCRLSTNKIKLKVLNKVLIISLKVKE